MLASIGVLLIRVVFGLTFAAHGTQKLFGWFGGGGIDATSAFFESLGIKPPRPMAVMSGLAEFGSGLLFALGLLTPLAALGMIGVMLVAIFTTTGRNGYWITGNGYEYNVAIITVAIAVILTGPGLYSLDALMRLPWFL